MNPTTGETDLDRLLRSLQPVLGPEPYAFCTTTAERAAALWPAALGLFREAEGVTLILPTRAAHAAALIYEGAWAYVTLTVHSSLAAVGMIAAISTRLAQAGISLNPVAGYYHDHLFVPWEKRDLALEVLAGFGRPGGPINDE